MGSAARRQRHGEAGGPVAPARIRCPARPAGVARSRRSRLAGGDARMGRAARCACARRAHAHSHGRPARGDSGRLQRRLFLRLDRPVAGVSRVRQALSRARRRAGPVRPGATFSQRARPGPLVRRVFAGVDAAPLPQPPGSLRGGQLRRVGVRRSGAPLPRGGSRLSREHHERCLVRPHRGPLPARDPPGDASDRDAGGHRARRERRHLGVRRSAGPDCVGHWARGRHGDRGTRAHECRDPPVRAARRLGRYALRARHARVRWRAGTASLARERRGGVRVGVDVGGTFTDLVALTPDGAIEVRKVATTAEDPTVGMCRALDALAGAPHAPAIELLVHGTTIATNALLERRGARVVLVTTRGFEDLLWLRRQDRAALYDLARHHPPPLVARGDVVGVTERIGPSGVLEPLTEGEVARVVAGVRTLAPEAVAIALLFAFRDPTHERRLAGALRDALPRVPVAAGHEVLPLFREFERTSTTTVEAYLRPKVSTYLERLEGGVRQRGIGALRVMTSSGGTRAPAAAAAHAASLALSGPAGGVVGARLVGAAVGLADLLPLDMGGTSADASLVVGGAPLAGGGGGVGGGPLALTGVLDEAGSDGGGSI